LDRHRCRQYFESRFTDLRMARDYVAVYQKLLDARALIPGKRHHPQHLMAEESFGKQMF